MLKTIKILLYCFAFFLLYVVASINSIASIFIVCLSCASVGRTANKATQLISLYSLSLSQLIADYMICLYVSDCEGPFECSICLQCAFHLECITAQLLIWLLWALHIQCIVRYQTFSFWFGYWAAKYLEERNKKKFSTWLNKQHCKESITMEQLDCIATVNQTMNHFLLCAKSKIQVRENLIKWAFFRMRVFWSLKSMLNFTSKAHLCKLVILV